MNDQAPHRRRNPLTGEWVLVSPHRTQRPWQGQVEGQAPEILPPYDPGCYLCPGNLRAGGERNPDYQSTYVFTNDFSALLSGQESQPADQHPLFYSQPVNGTCRVICFSPRHDLTLPEMEVSEIRKVVDLWIEQAAELGEEYLWVQIFENKGPLMGCSNPHPHGQIWASDRLPNEPAKEDRRQREYYQQHNSVLLLDYFEMECDQDQRVICQNDHWYAVIPFWACWPFEILLAPARHVLRLPDLSPEEFRKPCLDHKKADGETGQPFRDLISIFDGLARGAFWGGGLQPLAAARSHLSPFAPFGGDQEIYGRI